MLFWIGFILRFILVVALGGMVNFPQAITILFLVEAVSIVSKIEVVQECKSVGNDFGE